MSVDRIEQTRKVGIYEITVAINEPLRFGDLDFWDSNISDVQDRIEALLTVEVES